MKQGMPERTIPAPQRATRTVLAFDFGLKRIGVAVGEPELGTAHPLPPIAAPGFEAIGRLVSEWRPALLVVGLPVARVDERFTSVEAESRLRGVRKKSVDSVAAQLILEQYFDEAA